MASHLYTNVGPNKIRVREYDNEQAEKNWRHTSFYFDVPGRRTYKVVLSFAKGLVTLQRREDPYSDWECVKIWRLQA